MSLRLVLSAAALFCVAVHAQAPRLGALDDLAVRQHHQACRASSSNEDLTRNGDARGIPPGETLVLADLEGPGMITHIWNTIATYDPFYLRSLIFRVYYDAAEQPSIETPLGDFFGQGNAVHKDFSNLVVSVSGVGRSRNCFWRMPFRERVRVTLTNEHPTEPVDSCYWHIDWRKLAKLPADSLYLHARYRQEFPAQPGNYVIFDHKGSGQYAGTVYSAIQTELGWFGEGDEFFYIDGAERPQIAGTGTEEAFFDAWGFREFQTPYGGAQVYEGIMPGDRVSVCRWYIDNPIPFDTSLHLEIEHRGSIFNDDLKRGGIANMELGGFHERYDWLSSVAFWYQYPPVPAGEPLPPREQRMPPYREVDLSRLKVRANPALILLPDPPGINYIPSKPDATLEIDLEIAEPGRYQISAVLMHLLMGGVYQAYLDDKPIGGPIDLSAIGADPHVHALDLHDLQPGTHTLRFAGTGVVSPRTRTLAPALHALIIYKILLLRLDDMEGYRVVTKRLLQERGLE